MSVAVGWHQSAAPSGSGWAMSPAGLEGRMWLGSLELSMSGREWSLERGALIGVREVEGWDDKVRDLTESAAHASGDGVVSGIRRRGARTITVRGVVRGRTALAVREAKDLLGRQDGLFVLEQAGLRREATVRVLGLAWSRVSARFERFTLTLQSDDPLRYSAAVLPMSNGSLVLPNRGDEPASPLLELVGAHSALTIAHPGGSWSLSSTPAGVERIVDLREGDVWEGGVRVFGLDSGVPPEVPVGGSEWTISGLGSGTARVRRFEAWS